MVGICRLCASLRKNEQLLTIKDANDEICQKLQKCCNIQISIADALPKFVCHGCDKTLEQAYAFYCRVHDAQETLTLTFLSKDDHAPEKSKSTLPNSVVAELQTAELPPELTTTSSAKKDSIMEVQTYEIKTEVFEPTELVQTTSTMVDQSYILEEDFNKEQHDNDNFLSENFMDERPQQIKRSSKTQIWQPNSINDRIEESESMDATPAKRSKEQEIIPLLKTVLKGQKKIELRMTSLERTVNDHVNVKSLQMSAMQTANQSLYTVANDSNLQMQNEFSRLFPIYAVEEMNDIDEKLQDRAYAEAMVIFLHKLKEVDGELDAVFRRLFTDDLLHFFNWDGRLSKKALQKSKLANELLFGFDAEAETKNHLEFKAEVYNLFVEWGLSCAALNVLHQHAINSMDLLKMIEKQDIENIFNRRELMADKIKFRFHLQKWKADNKFCLLSCRSSDSTLSTGSEFPQHQEPRRSECNLREILSKTVAGKDVLCKFKRQNSLDESDQTSIVRIIVEYFVLHNIKMNPKVMKTVSESIVELFPTENELTYYVPRGVKKNPSGKLYDRYFNTSFKRKNYAPSTSKKLTSSNEPDIVFNNDITENKEFESKKNWLAYNIPEDIAKPWRETSALRMMEKKCLKEILQEWPRYKDPNGPILIDIDFETLYPGKCNLMLERIHDIERKFNEAFIKSHVRDKLNLRYFYEMQSSELSTDSKHFYFFNLLHAIIVPPRINKNLKPSISDAQNDMIVHLRNLSDFKEKEIEMKEIALNEGLTVQPKVFAIGELGSSLKEFYVYFDGLNYKVPTLIRAIDLVIKICFVFNLEFSAKSKYVWSFLQEMFFDIPYKEKIPKVQNILKKLNVN